MDACDGLFIPSEIYWFRIRPSQTESKIPLVIEGKTQQAVNKVRDDLVKMIKESIAN